MKIIYYLSLISSILIALYGSYSYEPLFYVGFFIYVVLVYIGLVRMFAFLGGWS